MGEKSRSNWNINICLKGDCRWQNTEVCGKCLKFKKYETVVNTEDSFKDKDES